MRATSLLLILFLGTVSAQAVPRYFVVAKVQPLNPTDVYTVRMGAMTAKRQIFVGFINIDHEPEVESSATEWLKVQQVLLGIKWFTTGSESALFIPALGGGVSYGDIRASYWTYTDAANPRGGFTKYGSTDRQYAGVFAEFGVQFRVKPTSLMLGVDTHLNMCYNSRTYDSGDTQNTVINAYSFAYILVGASYRF